MLHTLHKSDIDRHTSRGERRTERADSEAEGAAANAVCRFRSEPSTRSVTKIICRDIEVWRVLV